ncbi:hypothetical protein [Lysinibacillus sp. NPDC086135]|uniref:hypothetical protein n=1 Tax=Lysinibacillus sp. NPDC086135 TaxID=3364130 RepID=UPI00381708A9
MLSVTLLVLIIAYEIFRAFKLDEFKLVLNTIKSLKGKERHSPEMVQAGQLFLNNKRFITYILFEYGYLVVVGILFFTQYWLIALLITLQSLILYLINKKKNEYITYEDSAITILIIVLGLLLI